MRFTLFGYVYFGLLYFLNASQFRCDYKYFKDAEGYLKYNKIPSNWHEARLRCHLEGSVLASPINKGLRSAMETFMEDDGNSAVFTGINAYFSRGDFISIEGIPLSKIVHKWAKYEPDNCNDQEQYIMMLSSGELADVNGTEPLPYFCYKQSRKSLSTNECGTIDPEYKLERRTGSCYKFHLVLRTWSRAFMTCTAEGGYLAIINSETESQVIREIFAKYPSATLRGVYRDLSFLGFHDLWEHGEFLTVKGETLLEAGFDKFTLNQPNNLTSGQFCGGVERDGKYNDMFCETMLTFICEKDPESLLCDEEL